VDVVVNEVELALSPICRPYTDDAHHVVGRSGPHDCDEPSGDRPNGDEASFVSGIGLIELIKPIGFSDEDRLGIFEP
jgi:hypothetical protein